VCGISGRLHFDGAPVDPMAVRRMNEVQAHRGPDDSGVWVDGAVGLGARRLAILDLSEDGHMPMRSADGRYVVVYNGEIYNYPELRQRLEAEGFSFRSRCDTEVILHLYSKHGDDCVIHLEGMFAFAVWDSLNRRLLLARDRLGKKPLHYVLRPDALLFGSEIKALLTDPAVPRRPSLTAIRDFLELQYIPSEQTAFERILRLPPASRLICEHGRIRVERYWHLRFTPKTKLGIAEAEHELLALFDRATASRLLSDVPLGMFLSGGIDSAAVAESMVRARGGQPVKTFTIAFSDERFNEGPAARATAQRLGTEHYEMVVDADAGKVLPQIVHFVDEPFGDTSAVPTYYLAEFARSAVTVALNGDGGDEAFGGYERYAAFQLASQLRGYTGSLLTRIAALVDTMPEGSSLRSRRTRLKRFVSGLTMEPAAGYREWTSVFSRSALRDLGSLPFVRHIAAEDERFEVAEEGIDALLARDYERYLPGDLLVKSDRMTMAHSLEARSPLLDRQLVEFAASLPTAWKIRGLTGKKIFRRAMRRRLPAAVCSAKKAGFGMPVAAWMRGSLHDTARRVLLSPQAERDYLQPRAVRRLLDEHRAGAADHGQRLWSLLVLEIWHRMYIDSSSLERPSSNAMLEFAATSPIVP
jgi:asparagine synthase (glutamine-hydrolysing)